MAADKNSYKKSSFGPAFLFLEKHRREALADYYEFCRRMDDIADEPDVQNPAGELDFWADEIARVYDGRPETDLGKRLLLHVREFGITQDRFLMLIDGMRADLRGQTYTTFEELDGYIYRVAVVVGLATLDILGVKGPEADALANELGGAVQLTNIIRDVPDDSLLGRVYLPEELLARHGLTRQDILAGRGADALPAVLKHLALLAEDYYARALELMKAFPRLKMLPCRMMGYVYFSNLAKIRKTGFRFMRPVKLTKAEKLQGVLHALFKTVFR